MKFRYYIVGFTNGKTVFVSSTGEGTATILAQATMIKQGWSYDVKSITETDISTIDETDLVA